MLDSTTVGDYAEYGFQGTYSPEDNKLRLYSSSRFGDDLKQRIKKAGFRWASKQSLWVAPAWSVACENLLLELCGEIEDEDYSPEDRSADRAERFGDYRDKRRGEAGGHADAFDAGPACHGYQSADRAARVARRHDRQRGNAVSQWSKAEYWQERTTAVIRHALYKASASVRRGRILRIEAEQRKHDKETQNAIKRHDAWTKVAAEPDEKKAFSAAYQLSNSGGWAKYQHPSPYNTLLSLRWA